MSILDVLVGAPAQGTGPLTRAERLQRIRARQESAAHPSLNIVDVWNTFREIERQQSRLAALNSGFLTWQDVAPGRACPRSDPDAAAADLIGEAIADCEALLLDGK